MSLCFVVGAIALSAGRPAFRVLQEVNPLIAETTDNPVAQIVKSVSFIVAKAYLHLDRLFAWSRFWSRNPLLRERELQQARVLILNTLANRYLP
jgi:hypothetical protein